MYLACEHFRHANNKLSHQRNQPTMMQSDLLSNFTSSTDDVIALIYNNVNQSIETQPLDFHPCDIDDRNANFNCSAEEYLRFYRGPQTLPLIIVLPVSEEFIRISCILTSTIQKKIIFSRAPQLQQHLQFLFSSHP